jgi:hypothetical protein
MNISDPRSTIRIAEIKDTRTWWQRSSLSRISWRFVAGMTVYGALVGALLSRL